VKIFTAPSMSTTTIRIEDDLKARVAAAADQVGTTAHAFILEAIAQKVEQVETDLEFNDLAQLRWAKLLTTGKSVSWSDAKTYLEARSRGSKARKPRAKTPSR